MSRVTLRETLYTFASALATVASMACNSEPGNESQEPARSKVAPQELTTLFPIDSGMTMTYRVSTDGGRGQPAEQVRRVVRTVAVAAGGQCTVIESLTEGGSQTAFGECFRVDSIGIAQLSIDSSGQVQNDSGSTHYMLKAPLQKGVKWEWAGNWPGVGKAVIEYEALGPADVSVPSGNYRAEQVIQRVYTQEMHAAAKLLGPSSPGFQVTVEPTATRLRWFAAGVGVVREELTIGSRVRIVSELSTVTR